MKFNVGDRVRVCYTTEYDNVSVGECGTVVSADQCAAVYGVRFDERDIDLKHSCEGLCEDGYGWWCDEDMLEPAKETKFKVGDRVRVCDARDSDEHVDFGECGVVRGIHPANDYHRYTCYSVQFDKFNEGRHTCLGLCDEGHGWNCDEDMLEPAKTDKVAKFKVGEKVEILNGIGIPDYTKGWCMPEYVGDVVTIRDCEKYSDGRIAYRIWEYPYTFDERGLAPATVTSGFRGGKISTATSIIGSLLDSSDLWTSFSIKEGKTMRDKSIIFRVIDSERVDKTCNKTIPTKTTMVWVGELVGVAKCDADEYNERDGVLNAIANAVCGNFDREYGKFLAHKKREYEMACKCAVCGHTADTPEDARACEAAHEARKKAKREAWLEKREAAKRLREMEREGRIEEYMKQIAKRKKKGEA